MGKKLESNFINMVVVLFAITLVASAAVGGVYTLTVEPIALAKEAKQERAIKKVIDGEFDNSPRTDMWEVKTDDGGVLEFYPAKKNGELVGTAVKTYTKKGFSGLITLMVGFKPDGSIYNYFVLEHKETPGLGTKMSTWFKKGEKGDIVGKIPGTTGLKVSKDGGEVDAITAATISARAFLDAVNRAASMLQGEDAVSSATTSSK